MEYIVYRRYAEKALDGYMNLPYGTKCEAVGTLIMNGQRRVCYATSENGHEHFARNDDGKGLKRGELVTKITALTRCPHTKEGQKLWKARWARIWGDPAMRKFKRPEHRDHWLWNDAFYAASVEELEYVFEAVRTAR